MGLLDVFTGDAYKEAADQQRQYLTGVGNQVAGAVQSGQAQSLDALRSAQGGAIGSIQGGVNTARGDINAGQAGALDLLYSGQTGAAGALADAQAGGTGALLAGAASVRGNYDPLAAAGARYGADASQASQTSADALGLNGPEGVARAQNAFQAGPGYQFSVDQGLESVLRNANASGMAASGNQLRESQTFGQGLANQEFGSWQDRLASREGLYAPLEKGALTDVAQGTSAADLSATQGIANLYGQTGKSLADLYSTTGQAGAGIRTGAATSLADLAARGGLAESGVQTQTGQSIADTVRGFTGQQINSLNQLAPQYSGTYGTEAAAETGGSANLWNLAGSALKGASGMGWLNSLKAA